jgi:uncharacterized membrane protein
MTSSRLAQRQRPWSSGEPGAWGPQAFRPDRLIAVPVMLVVAGVFGLVAAMALTLDKIALLEDPSARLGCNFSVLIGCSTNLNSAQGEVFGFPNSLLGLVFWPAIATVGVALLAGARFPRWLWMLLTTGVTGAFSLVVWFVSQSLFVLHGLCPWCMVTWAVTIPLFWVVVLHCLKSGVLPAPAPVQRVAAALYEWVPLLTTLSFLIIVALAQWQLDLIGQLAL